jgi:thiosulfate/3-mercaptopyruvate sulfurtransferase
MTRALVILVALAGVARGAPSEWAHPELRVDAAWLLQHADDPALRIVDARPRDVYDRGHLPRAVSIPVGDTYDSTGHAAAPEEVLAALFGARGVDGEHQVIVYDDGAQTPAARVFWTLELLGEPQVAVLDGGLQAWRAAGGALSTAPSRCAPTTFRMHPRPSVRADKQRVTDAVGDPKSCILDVRSAAEYRGDDVRAQAGGHVPGATHLDWNVVFAADGRLKHADELRTLYATHGVTPDREVIPHCQSGQRSSVAYWTLRLLGYPRVRNYAASWVEWGNDPTTPKRTGDAP